MAWKSWDVYVVKDGETVHRGVTGGVSRQSARELASTLFNIAKDKLMLVPKGSAGRKERAATPMRPRLADLQLQGFMKRRPMRTWIVAVEAPSGEPSEATYVEVQGKTEAAALRAAQARKPGRKLTVRYAK